MIYLEGVMQHKCKHNRNGSYELKFSSLSRKDRGTIKMLLLTLEKLQ